MEFITVAEAASAWGVSERSVRNYCSAGRVPGAQMAGKTWLIPDDAQKPGRKARRTKSQPSLLDVMRREKEAGLSGGIYHYVQVELTYNSNHIEGSRLSHEQTRYIFETNTVGVEDAVLVDDIVETANHFRCVDMVIDNANKRLTQALIKRLHAQLKSGTTDAGKSWFVVGGYKRLPNEVGGHATTPPELVEEELSELLAVYEATNDKTFEDLVAFHAAFERIHPFQDGNGRVGRLLLFKECLRLGIVPFIITDELKYFYYRGLSEWGRERGYLLDTCLTAQDAFKATMARFGLAVDEGLQ